MVGLFTLESTTPTTTYGALADRIDATAGHVMCYSRLPLRQLLRYIATNTADMWWISEHESPRSIPPDAPSIEQHLQSQLNDDTELIIVEGLDWIASRSTVPATLAWLQRLDGLVRHQDVDVVFPLDPLTVESSFWRRLTGIAPLMTVAEPTASESVDHRSVEHDTTGDGGEKVGLMQSPSVSQSSDAVITHLVSLPRLGFTSAVLARRMLQWKRMGFDLSALEPALSLTDMDDAFSVYRSVELDIVRAIDALRLLETHESALTVTEREMFNYRMMSLLDVEQNVQDLEHLLSAR